MGAISRPSNCSRGDAVGLWKATRVRKCLGSWGPDLHSNTGEREREREKKKKKKTCETSLDWCCSLIHSALLHMVSAGTRRRPLALPQIFPPRLRSPFLLSFQPINFFFHSFHLIFLPLYLSTSPPIASITALSHPSVVSPAYPDLLLFFL